jgi:SAM-dependent methyltransferase
VALPAHAPRTAITGFNSYFAYQQAIGDRVVVPWIAARFSLAGKTVADFGAHEGGMLDAFRDVGADAGVGIEINEAIVLGSPFRQDEKFRLEIADLTAFVPGLRAYDVIVIHDVLEHVPGLSKVLSAAAGAVAPGGRIFVSFPPYYSMMGGHQQLARSRARLIPWLHYLPEPAFLRVARPGNTEYLSAADALDDMLSVRRTRLTIRRAERAFAEAGLVVEAREFFVLRPEYTVRYGWPTVRAGALGRMPLVREAVVNGAFYLLSAA